MLFPFPLAAAKFTVHGGLFPLDFLSTVRNISLATFRCQGPVVLAFPCLNKSSGIFFFFSSFFGRRPSVFLLRPNKFDVLRYVPLKLSDQY